MRLPKIWVGKHIIAQRGACDGAGCGHAQGCSVAASWGGSARSLGDHVGTNTSLRSVTAKKKIKSPWFWCITVCPVTGSSCFRKKLDSTLHGLYVLAPGLFLQVSFYTTQKLTTDSWSLEGSAAVVVNPACLGPAVTTAGVGQKRCLPPLLSPHSGTKFWPPKIFTKYTAMKFSFPAAA